jgi:hypothetical protein
VNTSITIPAQSVTIPSQDVTVTVPTAQIVYQNAWLGQTGNADFGNVFTPSTDGIYRFSLVIDAYANPLPAGAVFVSASLTYYPGQNGNIFSNTQSVAPDGQQTENQGGLTFVLLGKSSFPMSLSTSVGTTLGATLNHYDVYLIVEQLQ